MGSGSGTSVAVRSREDMLATMASMQDTYNRQVHAAWRTQGFAFYRAIWVECAELLDHYGWKWWKRQHPDAEQVKLEIVDIWHFGMSDLLRTGPLDPALVREFDVDADADPGGERFREAVEALAQATLGARGFALSPFVRVMQTLPMTFDELFELYVGKNVLNSFRQDHGYKTGEYRKSWGGREDNEHLVEVLRVLRCAPDDLPERLYLELAGRYTTLG